MRSAIWQWVRSLAPENCHPPRWMVAVRFVIYPLDSFYWHMSKSRGYDLYTDVWTIHGLKWTDQALYALANATGEIYRVKRIGDLVTLERIINAELLVKK